MSNYIFYNPSPNGARIGDCVIRAICKALDQTWEHTYVALCVQGFAMYDLPNADSVWEFMDKLTMMRESAPNEKSRRAIDKMIDELEN